MTLLDSPPLASITYRDVYSQQDSSMFSRLHLFVEAGYFDRGEMVLVCHLCSLVQEWEPDVILALSLAVHAPRLGHSLTDLRSVYDQALSSEGAPLLPWPKNFDSWLGALSESVMVSTKTGDGSDEVTPFVLDGHELYLKRYADHEKSVVYHLDRLARSSSPYAMDALQGKTWLGKLFPHGVDIGGVVDRQALAVAMALRRRLSVITGGPGTGKTWTLRNILSLFFIQHERQRRREVQQGSLRVHLMAPTGKAAARMKESLNLSLLKSAELLDELCDGVCAGKTLNEFLLSVESTTIHRGLGVNLHTPGRFRHHQGRPLVSDVVIVDEASMVDLPLMAKLLEAIGESTSLILIGDPLQLVSVEAGSVLADICEGVRALKGAQRSEDLAIDEGLSSFFSKENSNEDLAALRLCHVQLDKNYRFSKQSGIAQWASYLSSVGSEEDRSQVALADFEDVMWLDTRQAKTEDKIDKMIVDGYGPYFERLGAGPLPGERMEEYWESVLDLFDSFQILCAHRQGDLGVEAMNLRCEKLLAKVFLRDGVKGVFYAGRPIIVRQNSPRLQRFNGDMALLMPVSETLKGINRQGFYQALFRGAGGGFDMLPAYRLPRHDTAFAITIHQSQGSEFDKTMVMFADRDSTLLTRELLYTGLTRSIKNVTMVGSRDLLLKMATKKAARASGMSRRLRQLTRKLS
jgi:exodeoxyribonuclease V alpha subunit